MGFATAYILQHLGSSEARWRGILESALVIVWNASCLACLPVADRGKQVIYNGCNFVCEQGRYRIPHLVELLGSGPLEKIVVRKRLETSSLSYGQAATLSRVIMNKIMSIFGNMACNRCRRSIFQLHSESVAKFSRLPVLMCGCQAR